MDRQDDVDSPQAQSPPELQDFQVTREEYALYSGKGDEYLKRSLWFFGSLVLVLGLVSLDVWWMITLDGEDAFEAIQFTTLWGGIVGGGIVCIIEAAIESTITKKRRRRLLQGPVATQIEQYEAAVVAHRESMQAALDAHREAERQREEAKRRQEAAERARQEALLAEQRKKEEYWHSLGGIEFEEEMAKLFIARGYYVQTTPKSGDQGIDLIVKKNGKTTVVQCKAHRRTVGPMIVRDLYGSMVAYGADDAILACTGGFTKGVEDFVQGKPIRLVDVWDIVQVADAVADKSTQNEQSKWPPNNA